MAGMRKAKRKNMAGMSKTKAGMSKPAKMTAAKPKKKKKNGNGKG